MLALQNMKPIFKIDFLRYNCLVLDIYGSTCGQILLIPRHKHTPELIELVGGKSPIL
jgi:hypothetical protein